MSYFDSQTASFFRSNHPEVLYPVANTCRILTRPLPVLFSRLSLGQLALEGIKQPVRLAAYQSLWVLFTLHVQILMLQLDRIEK
jgi:hypothetical protein